MKYLIDLIFHSSGATIVAILLTTFTAGDISVEGVLIIWIMSLAMQSGVIKYRMNKDE